MKPMQTVQNRLLEIKGIIKLYESYLGRYVRKVNTNRINLRLKKDVISHRIK